MPDDGARGGVAATESEESAAGAFLRGHGCHRWGIAIPAVAAREERLKPGRNNVFRRIVRAAVSLGGILVIVCIQLTALLAPLAIGLSGAISGGVAGFTSILAWALMGVPASYAFVDVKAALAASAKSRYAASHVSPIQT